MYLHTLSLPDALPIDWERPEATAEAFAGGVLHTGDIGFLDDAGYLHLRDRKSLVIIRGGANVYPAEVERVLQELDGVTASAVVGVPDERLGERVVALVERDRELDEDGVRKHCAGTLAQSQVPARHGRGGALPPTPTGKTRSEKRRVG